MMWFHWLLIAATVIVIVVDRCATWRVYNRTNGNLYAICYRRSHAQRYLREANAWHPHSALRPEYVLARPFRRRAHEDRIYFKDIMTAVALHAALWIYLIKRGRR